MSAAPLQFAQDLTAQVNEAWESGELRERVTDTTRTLLDFWFDERFRELRPLNFHIGQEQAIKNVIYCHEVLKATSVLDVYQTVAPNLALEDGALEQLSGEKFQHPKYAIKMATGTGKTWVLDALLIWQYLNAQAGEAGYTKNFLIIAPGLIVYERLLDAFLGKVREEDGSRNFETSDIYSARELFLPDTYREETARGRCICPTSRSCGSRPPHAPFRGTHRGAARTQ